MEILSYSDFSVPLHQQVANQRIPISGTIEVTKRCPLNCVHCYNNFPMFDYDAKQNEACWGSLCKERFFRNL
jgi:hypothetical protein